LFAGVECHTHHHSVLEWIATIPFIISALALKKLGAGGGTKKIWVVLLFSHVHFSCKVFFFCQSPNHKKDVDVHLPDLQFQEHWGKTISQHALS
jgi:hypothetical protein